MHRFLPVVAFCLTILSLSAQGGLSVLQHPVKQEQTQTSSKNTPKKTDLKQRPVAKSKVYLLHSDLLRKDAQHPDAQIVTGNVEFRHDSVYMYCDSACYYDKVSSFEAFGNVKMVQRNIPDCIPDRNSSYRSAT